jgi:hypothetical protein
MILSFFSLLAIVAAQRILTTTNDTSLMYYETPKNSFLGCVRLNSDAYIDMTTLACNQSQCPRCFILTEGTGASDYHMVSLTLSNCHADAAYPLNSPEIFTTASKIFEYTFLNLGGPYTTFRVVAAENPENSRVYDIGSGGVHRYLTAFCYDGLLFTK